MCNDEPIKEQRKQNTLYVTTTMDDTEVEVPLGKVYNVSWEVNQSKRDKKIKEEYKAEQAFLRGI